MGLEVERDPQAPRLRVDRWVGAVVKERDEPIGKDATVVLPGSFGARPHLEGALQATQAPQDVAAVTFDLVAGPGTACRDEDVSTRLEVDRVDVEPVPRSWLGRRRGLRLRGCYVVEAVPFPAHESRLHVDLLNGGIEDYPIV